MEHAALRTQSGIEQQHSLCETNMKCVATHISHSYRQQPQCTKKKHNTSSVHLHICTPPFQARLVALLWPLHLPEEGGANYYGIWKHCVTTRYRTAAFLRVFPKMCCNTTTKSHIKCSMDTLHCYVRMHPRLFSRRACCTALATLLDRGVQAAANHFGVFLLPPTTEIGRGGRESTVARRSAIIPSRYD